MMNPGLQHMDGMHTVEAGYLAHARLNQVVAELWHGPSFAEFLS